MNECSKLLQNSIDESQIEVGELQKQLEKMREDISKKKAAYQRLAETANETQRMSNYVNSKHFFCHSFAFFL